MNDDAASEETSHLRVWRWFYTVGVAPNERAAIHYVVLTKDNLFDLCGSAKVVNTTNIDEHLVALRESNDEQIWTVLRDLFREVDASELAKPTLSEHLGFTNEILFRRASRVPLSTITSSEYHGYLTIPKVVVHSSAGDRAFLVGQKRSSENAAAARELFIALKDAATKQASVQTRLTSVMEACGGPLALMLGGLALGGFAYVMHFVGDSPIAMLGMVVGPLLFFGAGGLLASRLRNRPMCEYWVNGNALE